MKKFFAISLVLASMLYAEDSNKTQIFMDKYLPDSKTKQFDISPEELREKSKDLNLNDIKSNMDMNQKQFDKKFGEIQTAKSKSAEEQAKEVSEYVRSDKFQKGVKENENYILYDKSIDWSKYTGKYNNHTKEIMQQLEATNSPLLSKNKFLNPNEKLFIVISSSLKKETIRNYFKLLEKVNTDVTFILRGVIGTPKKIMPTINYINDLLVKDPNGDPSDQNNRYSFNVEINPKITRRFDVKKVPAVLFIKNYNPVVQEFKDVIGTPDKDELYWIAYGEASIDYALEQINKKAKSDGIERLLKAMSQSFYNQGE
ncbi:conjugal transfer protein TrbC (plasmid) [Campylobacter iguaniorum]|uniref:Conjugal transfer protein TrbC n=1 Tax=Campylobacter iguaniorum TaxID=1244531 RepID=A0A076FDW4_9BACT|nr:TrbC family F-type conjugative pilus assembly protein [Campylobacter iguaniorum]AII15597.1 conjugal transfer protein TrbC [Campylobacter iguaniorum]